MPKPKSIYLFVFNSFPQLLSCLSIYYYYLDETEKSISFFSTDVPVLVELLKYHQLQKSIISLREVCSVEVLSLYVPHEGIYAKIKKYINVSPKLVCFGDSLGLHYSATLEFLAWRNLFVSLFSLSNLFPYKPFQPSSYFLSKRSITTQNASPVTLIPSNHYRGTYSFFSLLYDDCFVPNLRKSNNKISSLKPRLTIFAFSRSTSCIASHLVPRMLLRLIISIRLSTGFDVFCCYHPSSSLGNNSKLDYPIEFYLPNLNKYYDDITIVSTSTSGYASSLLLDYVSTRFSFFLCLLEIVYLPFRSKLKRLLRSLRLALMLVSPVF